MTPAMPSTCFAGRIVFRDDELDGLDWQQACPVPAEQRLNLDPDPPMYFCAPHFQAIFGELYGPFEQARLIDPDIVGDLADDEDGLERSWRREA